MIAALFAWFGGSKVPQWLQDLLIILLVILIVAGGTWYYGHVHYEAGVAAQIAKDTAERTQIIADNDKKTAELQARATTAEKAYDDERNQTANFNAANPLEPIRLCNTTAVGTGHLSNPGSPLRGAKSASPAAAGIQQMPTGNSSLRDESGGRDISGLLEALAESADAVSASLREFQNR